jgi:hypothetical protein
MSTNVAASSINTAATEALRWRSPVPHPSRRFDDGSPGIVPPPELPAAGRRGDPDIDPDMRWQYSKTRLAYADHRLLEEPPLRTSRVTELEAEKKRLEVSAIPLALERTDYRSLWSALCIHTVNTMLIHSES